MDNMGERIPIKQMLGILRAVYNAMPKLHISAFAYPDMTNEIKSYRLNGDYPHCDDNYRTFSQGDSKFIDMHLCDVLPVRVGWWSDR